MFLPIKDETELNRAELNIRQALRIAKSRKRYAVINGQKLHLVDDLNRLIFDTLRAYDLYDIEIYQIN